MDRRQFTRGLLQQIDCLIFTFYQPTTMYKDPSSLAELMRKFGITEQLMGKIARTTAEIEDTLSRLNFDSYRAYLDFRAKLLSVYQNRETNEAKLAARLSEIDTTQAGRHGRAACYVNRVHALKAGAFWAPASHYMHLYRAYAIAPKSPQDSFELRCRMAAGIMPVDTNTLYLTNY